MAMAGRMFLRAGYRQAWSSSQIFPAAVQRERRWASQLATKEPTNYEKRGLYDRDDLKQRQTTPPVIYEGAMSETLRRVKMLSFTTCCLSVVGGPFVTFFTSPDLSVIMKGALASTMVLLSASTTYALHWFASPYIHKLTWIPGAKEIDVEVLSWMSTTLKKKIRFADVRTPYTQRPLVTFSAKNEYYFIDKDNFPNQELLEKLLPEKSAK